MRSVVTRAWDGVLAVLDTPARDGRFLMAPPEGGASRWFTPIPIYVGHGNPCGHVCLHHVGQATSVDLDGVMLRGSGWLYVQDEVFDTVPSEMFVGVDVELLGDWDTWRLRSIMLHMDPHLAAWPQAKIRHYPQPSQVCKVPEEPQHLSPCEGWPPEGEGWYSGGYWAHA